MIYLKSVVIGNGGVGKTTLLITYFTGSLPEEYTPQVVEDIVVESNEMKIGFWDTGGGGEDYSRLRPLSYPQTDVFILCFSLSNIRSFQDLYEVWYPEVAYYCPNTPIILVGTKLDFRSDEQFAGNNNPIITTEDGQKMADDIGAVKYFECSSFLKKGVHDIFDFAISIGMKNERSSHKS